MTHEANRPLRVLFVSSGNGKNFDIVPFIREQGESLRKRGVHVDYYPVIGKGLLGYLRQSLALRKQLKDKKYDVIHGHFILSAWVAVMAGRRTPVVISLMGSDAYGEYIGEKKVALSSRYLTLLTLLIQPFVNAIISKSANIDSYVYLRKKAHIVPNGIDIEKFKPATENVRHALGFRDDRKQVLFLGSEKSIRKNISLVRRSLERLGRQDVELINPYPVLHTSIPKYLNASHVMAVCSFMEGSPNVVKEAMACNCPVVSTEMGDVKWVFGDTPGYFLSSFDTSDYAQALDKALAFAEESGRTRGRERIFSLGLDSESIARRLISIYRSVLK